MPVGADRAVQVPRDRKTLYNRLGSRIGFRKERRELTVAFAAGGLALMMLGRAVSLLWFGRLPRGRSRYGSDSGGAEKQKPAIKGWDGWSIVDPLVTRRPRMPALRRIGATDRRVTGS
jgi:hypothetical protein